MTLGIVNVGNDGFILKDPITGIGNVLAHTKDALFNNKLSKGVWLGKRTINGFGFSSYATELLNVNVLHYAFMIDGYAYHLKGEKGKSSGSGSKIHIVRLNESLDHYEWFYKGKSKRSRS